MNMILFQSILACAVACLFAAERCPDGESISSRLVPTPAVTGRPADPANRISWPSLIGRDGPAFQILAIETDDGGDSLASGGHNHKSKAPGPTIMPLLHHVCRFNFAERLKHLAKVVPRHVTLQVTYIDIHSVPPFLCIEHPCLAGVPSEEKWLQRRVLRQVMLSTANDLASRLHQMIISGP
jgi:hypothetical protein